MWFPVRQGVACHISTRQERLQGTGIILGPVAPDGLESSPSPSAVAALPNSIMWHISGAGRSENRIRRICSLRTRFAPELREAAEGAEVDLSSSLSSKGLGPWTAEHRTARRGVSRKRARVRRCLGPKASAPRYLSTENSLPLCAT